MQRLPYQTRRRDAGDVGVLATSLVGISRIRTSIDGVSRKAELNLPVIAIDA
jgi:hypothetical protein